MIEFADRASQNLLLRGRNTHYYWSGEQTLSIKSFVGGRALYSLGGARYAVDDASYFVVNRAQPYTIEIANEQPLESFCVFFTPTLASDAHHTLHTPAARLLDAPEPNVAAISFYERLFPHDDIVTPLLFDLREKTRLTPPDALWLDERCHELMHALLRAHHLVRREVEALPSARATTRDEIYRRVYRAREYMAALYHTPITLDELSHVACLSPNHLLRSYRQVLRQTPHQFLTERRLARARELLTTTDESITAICFDVGFTSLGSFSSLFRRVVGVSPEQFRRAKR